MSATRDLGELLQVFGQLVCRLGSSLVQLDGLVDGGLKSANLISKLHRGISLAQFEGAINCRLELVELRHELPVRFAPAALHIQQLIEALDNFALRGANWFQLLADPLLDVAVLGTFMRRRGGRRNGFPGASRRRSLLRSGLGFIRGDPSLRSLGSSSRVLGAPRGSSGAACTVDDVVVSSLDMRSGASESMGSRSPGGGGTITHWPLGEAELLGGMELRMGSRDAFCSSQNTARPNRPTSSPAAKAAPKTGKEVMTIPPAQGVHGTGMLLNGVRAKSL